MKHYKAYIQKLNLFPKLSARALLVLLFIICAPSFSAKLERISDFIMPISEHSELRVLEVDFILNDINKPNSSISPTMVKLLKELGAVSYLDFTYTWGEPEGLLLLQAKILKYPSKELAMQTLVANFSGEMPEGFSKIDDIGDFAVMYLNKTLYFVHQDLAITFNTVSDEVDLVSVGRSYSRWLKEGF